ncbi:MAG: ferredoxin [Myxococcales bacterium]|nr:ferredoxin [Myxococcales bacterium]
MKIRIDYDLCEANGVCVKFAPTVFELDDDDNLHLLIAEPAEELRDQVKKAEQRCPKAAISVED